MLIQDSNLAAQVGDQVQAYKDCPNCLIPEPTMFGGKENLWCPDALKYYISKLFLPKRTWKRIKTVFFKIQVTTYSSELLNLGAEIKRPNSTLSYENLPEFSPGYIYESNYSAFLTTIVTSQSTISINKCKHCAYVSSYIYLSFKKQMEVILFICSFQSTLIAK